MATGSYTGECKCVQNSKYDSNSNECIPNKGYTINETGDNVVPKIPGCYIHNDNGKTCNVCNKEIIGRDGTQYCIEPEIEIEVEEE